MTAGISRVLRDSILSMLCFLVLLAALVWFDPRVGDRVGSLAGSSPEGWTAHALGIFETVKAALSDLTVTHAPYLVFAAVGALLFFAMLRS